MSETAKDPTDKTPRTEKSNMDQPQEEFIEPSGAHPAPNDGDPPAKKRERPGEPARAKS